MAATSNPKFTGSLGGGFSKQSGVVVVGEPIDRSRSATGAISRRKLGTPQKVVPYDRVYSLTGSAVFVTVSTAPSASGSLDNLRRKQRNLYTRYVMGQASNSDLGFSSVPNDNTAPAPSWTQHYANKKFGFVIPALSASQHRAQVLNAYQSASSVPLESSPVPASGSVYFSKLNRFVQKTYAVTASADLVTTLVASHNPANISFAFSAVSGVLCSGAFGAYAEIPINIPDRGKLRDIKVWVELIHQDPGYASPMMSGSVNGAYLGKLGVYLKSPYSPNLFQFGHPIWNGNSPSDASNSDVSVGVVPGFGTYVLWEGSYMSQQLGATPSSLDAYTLAPQVANNYRSWDSDRHMRTVFYDGSPNLQPCHLEQLSPQGNDVLVGGVGLLSGSAPNFFQYQNFLGQLKTLYGNIALIPSGSASGSNAPWFCDVRISGSRNVPSGSASPPPGWLTGPGGTAAANEFPTTGSNNGPTTLQPMYPLLEDVVQQVISISGTILDSFGAVVDTDKRFKVTGVRPGLRGTEINGTWKLCLNTIGVSEKVSPVVNRNVYFRQVRLEMTYDTGVDVSGLRLGKQRRFGVSSPVFRGQRMGAFRRVHIMSSSLATNIPVDGFALLSTGYEGPVDYYRTIGITDKTSSFGDFAVFTRITGSLASKMSSDALRAYLSNEFGTPYIPLSSGSGVDMSFQSLTDVKDPTDDLRRQEINLILNPRTLIGQSQTLQSVLGKEIDATRTTAELAGDVAQTSSGSA